jgi:hypothetical protein
MGGYAKRLWLKLAGFMMCGASGHQDPGLEVQSSLDREDSLAEAGGQKAHHPWHHRKQQGPRLQPPTWCLLAGCRIWLWRRH